VATNTMNPVTFCGRTFSVQEVELMRVIAQDYAGLGVTEIARTVCELLDWKRPNRGLKNHECRQLLERLEAEGRLRLPAVRKMGGRGSRRVDVSQLRWEPAPVECAAKECEPLELALVEGAAESRRWREHMERYHYLGCCVPFGAHLRYWVRTRQAGTRLSIVDLARLEDEAAGHLDWLERRATDSQPAVDREQRKIPDFALATYPGASQ
jgi:Domain of unknown function (DUF4338)